jgi:hypothetical protein
MKDRFIIGLLLMVLLSLFSISYADVVGGTALMVPAVSVIAMICVLVFAIKLGVKFNTKIKNKIAKIFATICVIIVTILIMLVLIMLSAKSQGHPSPYRRSERSMITSYNMQYMKNLGSNKSSTDVIALINMIKAHNANEKAVSYYGIMTIEGIDDVSKVDNNKKYHMYETGFNEKGCINSIQIIESEETAGSGEEKETL